MSDIPFVSICTPTFNRRPFIPNIIKCFLNQDYPKDRMEWIIIDDGTDKIEDLVVNIPQVKYFKYEEKMTLGKKRNLMHSKCSGSIIVYMDDDDYYPDCRVGHAVETLQKNPEALCAGSSEMHIYFKHINKMYQFGPYGLNHSTAATFAFRRILLDQTSYNDTALLAEERDFLKGYTIPFVQLEPLRTILVFSHNHNSFDKKTLLENKGDKFINPSPYTVDHFVKEIDLKQFFLNDIDELLANYEPGRPEHKPEILKEIEVIKARRIKMEAEAIAQHKAKQQQQQQQQQNNYSKQLSDQSIMIQQLLSENNKLKEKNTYLENKIGKLIQERITALKIVSSSPEK